MTEVQRLWKKSKLTKRQLADKLGVPFFTVYAWMRKPGGISYRGIPEKQLSRMRRLTG